MDNSDKKLAIIIPYRNREEHKSIFIPYMSFFLKSYFPTIHFSLIIVEQKDDQPFNRAKLLNIGFQETNDSHDYFCMHDIDMLPMPQMADYSFVEAPTHLAAQVGQFNYKLPYNEYFGGVTLIDKKSFLKFNGYSNEYWGWGAEDDDLFLRILRSGLSHQRRNCSFISLPHKLNNSNQLGGPTKEIKSNEARYHKFRNGELSHNFEGLNSLKYHLSSKTENTLSDNGILVHLEVLL